MRYLLALVPLLTAFAAIPPAHAADASDPCLLLDWHDLQSIGVTGDTQLETSTWHRETTPPELPGSQLSTALCAVVTRTDAGRTAMTLNLTSIKGKLTEAQFVAWLESVAKADARENEKDVKEFNLENAACESGRDELTVPGLYEGDKDTTVIEHFVACDEHVGLVHVSMNAQVADGRKGELPDPAQVKALLDKSVARMKQTAFRTPD